jgi:hypothetical protein
LKTFDFIFIFVSLTIAPRAPFSMTIFNIWILHFNNQFQKWGQRYTEYCCILVLTNWIWSNDNSLCLAWIQGMIEVLKSTDWKTCWSHSGNSLFCFRVVVLGPISSITLTHSNNKVPFLLHLWIIEIFMSKI